MSWRCFSPLSLFNQSPTSGLATSGNISVSHHWDWAGGLPPPFPQLELGWRCCLPRVFQNFGLTSLGVGRGFVTRGGRQGVRSRHRTSTSHSCPCSQRCRSCSNGSVVDHSTRLPSNSDVANLSRAGEAYLALPLQRRPGMRQPCRRPRTFVVGAAVAEPWLSTPARSLLPLAAVHPQRKTSPCQQRRSQQRGVDPPTPSPAPVD